MNDIIKRTCSNCYWYWENLDEVDVSCDGENETCPYHVYTNTVANIIMREGDVK